MPNNAPNFEIERKFLASAQSVSLDGLKSRSIVQGYISTEPVIRLRKQDDEHFLTVKKAVKDGGGMVNQEFETAITQAQFYELWKKVGAAVLFKQRYLKPLNDGLIAEIDVFSGNLTGLMLIEVEFPDVESAQMFTPPEWFGREVTGDFRYANNNLALCEGIPQ